VENGNAEELEEGTTTIC